MKDLTEPSFWAFTLLASGTIVVLLVMLVKSLLQ